MLGPVEAVEAVVLVDPDLGALPPHAPRAENPPVDDFNVAKGISGVCFGRRVIRRLRTTLCPRHRRSKEGEAAYSNEDPCEKAHRLISLSVKARTV
jgi:hypothetical protein